MFSKEDQQQIKKRGSDPEVIWKQIERFRTGFPFTELVRPATPGDGIRLYKQEEMEALASRFDRQRMKHDICRFIPASGAATRMFKDLFALREMLDGKRSSEQEKIVKTNEEAKRFFDALADYPFYNDLELQGDEVPAEVLDRLLTEKGLKYGTLPKGLLKFHRYDADSRTAFEEHLHEAVAIAGPQKNVQLHFTISEEHMEDFRKLEQRLVPELEKQYGVEFDINYSNQKKETDTIAVDNANQPFRDEDGRLVFRPGGHGALLSNLNDIESDVIFINNIDNVSTEERSRERILHKKMLAGVLIGARHEIFSIQKELRQKEGPTNLVRAEAWVTMEANEQLPASYHEWDRSRKCQWLLGMLDRPLRVCGMVRNEGEPGGGPFYTRDTEGKISLQIVETSQVDMEDEEQVAVLKESTHFNPVDIVCSTMRADGSYFNLSEFVDHDTGFISQKSVRGRDLRALELPGLWNGSMAGWNTFFVEIPAETFSPVKTIFDLLKSGHRG